MSDWLDKEMAALDAQLEAGTITLEEYRRALRELRRDAQDEDAKQDIRDAGRGHLLGDW
jgi:hypothetical protein